MTELLQEIKKIHEQLNALQKEVRELKKDIQQQNQACNKMTNHIDFIDNIYNKIRLPLQHVCNRLLWWYTPKGEPDQISL